MSLLQSNRNIGYLLFLLAVTLLLDIVLASSSNGGIILRIRLGDGTMEKVQVPPDEEDRLTLHQILSSLSVEEGSSNIQVGSQTMTTEDSSSTVSKLGLKHGSLISITPTNKTKPTESRFSQLKHDSNIWNPFPELAKDYEHALLKTKTRRSAQKGMSYADIARLQSSLHIVEPQKEGPLKRVSMCKISAERFHANGVGKKEGRAAAAIITPRVGLLLGTIQTERAEMKAKKARTSLSSQTSDTEYCTVAKVQALWEPQGQQQGTAVYDAATGRQLLESNPRVVEIAGYLGLVPVGWIFSYQENNRHENEGALPIWGVDVQTGASLQISNMRTRDRTQGAKFVTLAMDANTGATEAFQLSDESVQMVAEGMLVPVLDGSKNGRHVPTKHALLVDGKETNKLDSVLCLVNTAMLSHTGSFSGKSATSSVKKNGNLTTKTKKALLGALDDDPRLLEELCDLNTILALDQTLPKADSEELCQLVRKWARGQKQGTLVGPKLKMQLRSILES
jgi:hypothetical protein